MAAQVFAIDNPETWHLAATPDKELQEMIDSGVKPRFTGDSSILSLSEKRARYAALFKQDADEIRTQFAGKVSEEQIFIPVQDGYKVRALVYRPENTQPEDRRPLVVLIHGGGFILGNAEMETPTCIEVVQSYGCVAISLEYRLSPEVKFPVAYEDCWDALQWIIANASTLTVDLTRGFIFGGTSAGSHISIPLAHRARDEGLSPPITGLYHSVPPALPPQALIERYKPFYRSRDALRDGMTLTSKSTELYDMAVEPDFTSPLWSPLLWPTGHKDLPPTFFQICGADLLRDEALIYERELRLENGVKTRAVVYQGLPHIFWYNYPAHSASAKLVQDAVAGLGWLLGLEV
ncbi:Alpha/Beta hydrolase protein [Dactylonectria macrodidyma]|uniref:Alpha/Beta hydrolase protein n=1 Tax=Dactylonectria macrodidyma TaxID=307937 RepID=A0A9P9F8F0_9HYPO|nr:Alpha/Beta hydrolase protein [Dactylonectria macrodidyma]